MEIVAKANQVTVMDHEKKSKKEHDVSDPMTIAREVMEQWNPQITDDLPDAFCGKVSVPLSEAWMGNAGISQCIYDIPFEVRIYSLSGPF
jgi:hypothetical protein